MKTKTTDQAKTKGPPQQNPPLEPEVLVVPPNQIPALPNPQDPPTPVPPAHILDPVPPPNPPA